MSKIRVTRTEVFEYDPYLKDKSNTPHGEYCEREPNCKTIEDMMGHDKEDIEEGVYGLDDLAGEAESTDHKWETIN